MRDLRILTLFKQHSMDSYDAPLESQYSCWGWADGVDIDEVAVKEKPSIASMWSALAKKQKEVNGRYTSQSIGLIRCGCDPQDENVQENYWRENSKMPFLGLAFLQLKNQMDYSDVARKIENEYNNFSKKRKAKKCNIITYFTFDNADLVLLLSGNDLAYMERRIESIKCRSDVQYVHSMFGVLNNYLDECLEQREFLKTWRGTKCFLEEHLDRIMLNLETSGDISTLSKTKYLLQCQQKEEFTKIKGYDTITYSYGANTNNIIIEIADTNVKTLLSFTIANGFITHQNSLYGKGIYHIETNWIQRLCRLMAKESNEVEQNTTKKEMSWCEVQLEQFSKRIEKIRQLGDDSLYSYYHAIIQSLNLLCQYEKYGLAKKAFYLIYPAFDMFIRLLDDAYRIMVEHGKYEVNENQTTIKYFADSVNSIMYHTLSMGQSLFMVPGYSGISFTVPIKLLLMYVWVVRKVAYVLNDCRFEYQCILAPEMEARPKTMLLDFDMSNHNRLICVWLAKRSLFWPRNLMLILTHEVGHYIGKSLRKRERRAKYIVRTVAYSLAESIIPFDFLGEVRTEEERRFFEGIKGKLKSDLQIWALEFLGDSVKNSGISKEYYATDLEKVLCEQCRNFLRHVDTQWDVDLPSSWNYLLEEVLNSSENFQTRLKYLHRVYRSLKENVRYHMARNTFQMVVHKIFKVYGECFADISALAILECTQEDFRESFGVSEGIKAKDKPATEEQEIREWVIGRILKKDEEVMTVQKTELAFYAQQASLEERLYKFVWTREMLYNYANECYNEMILRVEQDSYRPVVQELRKCFVCFGKEEGNQSDIIFENVMKNIDEYMKEMDFQRKEQINQALSIKQAENQKSMQKILDKGKKEI